MVKNTCRNFLRPRATSGFEEQLLYGLVGLINGLTGLGICSKAFYTVVK